MKFGREQIEDIVRKISAKELNYIDSVVVGDNSSGKSLLLKEFVQQVNSSGAEVYFIDAVNRSFNVKEVPVLPDEKPEYKPVLLETRMREDYFNLKDSFNCYGTLTETAERIYPIYEAEVQALFYELTGTKFTLMPEDPFGEVRFQEGKGLLSSGYQAIVRTLLELLYYDDAVIGEKGGRKAWVVIDELDEFLSPRYSARILEFLKEKFPWADWLVSTHSCDLIANSSDANLIVLDDGECEVIDINDYSSVSEVQIIFERLFGRIKNEEDAIDGKLRRLLNNKINNAWKDSDEELLKGLQQEPLTASQSVILRQIQEW